MNGEAKCHRAGHWSRYRYRNLLKASREYIINKALE